ncbi:MAG: DUF1028 domain-containing protein [Bacteroidota bacterium]|nr:DUF1028 domain-containing protein [Bacteroidota bacterium]
MKKLLFFMLLISTSIFLQSQDTFSIIALDTITGEIGGAGASCIDDNAIAGGVLIINDIIPGRGGIHTQAYWRPQNQQNAHDRMVEGMSPQEIIDWLIENDVQNYPAIRQYGIVDFDSDGHPRSAAFTGSQCDDYKNHIIGPNYAIQGNILLGQQILDSMEMRFLNTEGMLAEKLMAALQGANVPGADTRCMGEGVSSLSAFVRVAQTSDTMGTYFCDLVVPETPYGIEPIDSLQVLFDNWLISLDQTETPANSEAFIMSPNPLQRGNKLRIDIAAQDIERILVFDQSGRALIRMEVHRDRLFVDTSDLQSGVYVVQVFAKDGKTASKKLIIK